jgi:hypothetical protein
LKISEVANFWATFHSENVFVLSLAKIMDWAKLWLIFSQNHLVTLFSATRQLQDCAVLALEAGLALAWLKANFRFAKLNLNLVGIQSEGVRLQ